jgi:hypothetical protein
MHEQIAIPESYLALFKDGRQRLTAPADVIFAGYDLCEDLAQMLSERCRALHQVEGIDERTVLQRAYDGLLNPDSPIGPAQSVWVTRRAGELLEWLSYLPPACALEDEARVGG